MSYTIFPPEKVGYYTEELKKKLDNKYATKKDIENIDGVIKITEEEFKAHEEEYRASGKTYMVISPESGREFSIGLSIIDGLICQTFMEE